LPEDFGVELTAPQSGNRSDSFQRHHIGEQWATEKHTDTSRLEKPPFATCYFNIHLKDPRNNTRWRLNLKETKINGNIPNTLCCEPSPHKDTFALVHIARTRALPE